MPDGSKNRTEINSAIEAQLVGCPEFDAFVLITERTLNWCAAKNYPEILLYTNIL
jgi:hypothetical protein